MRTQTLWQMAGIFFALAVASPLIYLNLLMSPLDKFAHDHRNQYSINLDEPSHYYSSTVISDENLFPSLDEHNIHITMYKDERVHHPVDTAWMLLKVINSYQETGHEHYLEIAKVNVDNLVHHSIVIDGVRWFPYEFEHSPRELKMNQPWVSGMAQGMMMSVFARMYDITADTSYIDLAEETFASFSIEHSEVSHWFTLIATCGDKECMYFEEYPSVIADQNAHVVNGHIYSLLGLHDYYRISGDRQAQNYFNAGALALENSFDLYRRPGQPSWYAMTPFGHEEWGAPESYHAGVTVLLRSLGDIADAPTFTEQAELLSTDHGGR